MAKVRGTRYNTGDGIRMALDIGAQPYGQWSGCHSCAWERNAGDFGAVETRHNGFRHSYLYGIIVNADGKRFVDEGADFRNYTYAKYGRVDPAAARRLRLAGVRCAGEAPDARRIQAARRDQGDAPTRWRSSSRGCRTWTRRSSSRRSREYNAAITRDVPFNPNVKDGLAHRWARRRQDRTGRTPIETAAVRGLLGRLRHHLHVRRREDRHHRARARHRGRAAARPLCGRRMVGGIFYFNYPGATGLMSSAVFGRWPGGARRDTRRLERSRFRTTHSASRREQDPAMTSCDADQMKCTTARRRSSSSHRSPARSRPGRTSRSPSPW